jgi:DNA-binding transcriptional regulator YiaG
MKKETMHPHEYQYRECGLDNVILVGGVTIRETPRGQVIHIEDVEGLHRAISEVLLSERKKLSGRELRFLRHELNMTQDVLAALLGTDVQSVARWEKARYKVPGPADRLIRILYREKISGNPAIVEPLKKLAELDEIINNRPAPMQFCPDERDGWRRAA